MDGLANVAAVRTNTLEHNGKTYTLAVLGLQGYAEKEAYVLSHKPSPLKLLRDLPALPDVPTMPLPPDAGATTDDHSRYRGQLEEYYAVKRTFDDAVATRIRMEESLRKDAQSPRFITFEEENQFDSSLHGIGWRLWRAVRANHPEINSVQAALNLIHEIGTPRFQEVLQKLEHVEERDLLPKLNGSVAEVPGQVAHPGP